LKSSESKNTAEDKFSLESTFLDSIIGSSQIEKYKFVCFHCRKQYEFKHTLEHLVIPDLPSLEYNFKELNPIPIGTFQEH
jgi:hypothetical protein